MYHSVSIQEDLYWIGGNDRKLALFEGTFPVPRGVSYNAYLLLDEKTVLFDTVDSAVGDVFFESLEHVLAGRTLDYVVIHHMEPDHSATFARLVEKYPDVTVVTNAKVIQMLGNYFGYQAKNAVIVKEGDTFSTGKHLFKFIFAPMVHWPEVMFSYDTTDGILFTADAFGTFGALGGSIFADESNFERDYLAEARRYYTNIVGKYGLQVQNALKKVAALTVNTVCPLHGPVWRKDFAFFLDKYLKWSSYTPEDQGVALFYSSVYGHTQNAAEVLASMLAEEGVKEVKVYDVSSMDVSELVAEAFRLSHLVFATTTYNNGVFVRMETFLTDLAAHNLMGRKYAIIENGSWAPTAAKGMEEIIAPMKNMTKIGDKITVLSALKEGQLESLRALAKEIAADIVG